MLFSVIIPTCDRLFLLTRTLASVRAQRFTDYELIVVDNGSTDGTAQYLRGLGDRAQVITQPNLGPGGGRNAGARRARGDYFAFMDSDDLWFPWTLECFARSIERHGRPAMLAAKMMPFFDEAELSTVQETPLKADAYADYFASYRPGFFLGGSMAVLRRDAFLATGGYTEQPVNCEDHDLILRMGTVKGFVPVLSPIMLGWRRHSGSLTMNTARTVEGNLFLIEQERRGAYPGGDERRRARRVIVTRHVRPTTLACLKTGLLREAWRLYWSTFGWHLRLFRLKYLVAFPVLGMAAALWHGIAAGR